MVSPELTPLQEAYQEIPERWYERTSPHKSAIKITFATSTVAYCVLFLSGNDQIAYHLIGAGLFIASAIADRITTGRCFDVINNAAANNIDIEHEESNPLLPKVTNSRDFNFHPKTALLDLVGLTTSFALPNIAATFITAQCIASLNNLRVAKRYMRAIEIEI